MMDFLRRLAPPRETDATRAVAVLPSRFASEGPLRSTIAQARSSPRPEDDEASQSLDVPSAPARRADSGLETQGYIAPLPAANRVINGAAALRHIGSGKQPPQTTPRPLGAVDVRPTQRDIDKAARTTHSLAAEININAVGSSAFEDQHGAAARHATPGSPELHRPARALAANPILQAGTMPPARPTAALPLSQAALAQRTSLARDDSQVVHVTIGRIDVVANTAPAPAVRRNPAPRQATVTLADYLRGGKGVRQ